MSLNAHLASRIASVTSSQPQRILLDAVTPELVRSYSTVIATVETQAAVLANVSEDEMKHIKVLTDNCANLIWVTGGHLFQGAEPEMAVAFGLSRALMLEQPSLRFFVVDVDMSAPVETISKAILYVLDQATTAAEPDFEYIQHDSALHVSRFVPEYGLNQAFRQAQGAERIMRPLKDAGPFQLGAEVVGQVDSIFLRQQDEEHKPSGSHGHVEVAVKAVGLNTRVCDTQRNATQRNLQVLTLSYVGLRGLRWKLGDNRLCLHVSIQRRRGKGW